MARRIVHPEASEKWQAQGGAVEINAKIQPEKIDFDTFLKAQIHPQQPEQ